MLLAAVLEKAGHEVVQVANGSDAWRVLQREDAPRLAILDWMMPGLDGLEVVRRVRVKRAERAPHVILLTTRGSKADVAEALKAGADDHLTKPYDLGELRARIEVGRRMLTMRDEITAQVVKLQDALAQVTTLRGLLPICAHCKSIRDDKGYWQQVETYVAQHAGCEFTHGVCPSCMAREYPELANAGPGR